jgi:DNA-binding Xre family transcriptional regulator
MNDFQIGHNLLIVMAKNNIRTISELQKRTGISRVTLSKILNGKAESISLNTVVRICHGINCDVSDLVKVKKVS